MSVQSKHSMDAIRRQVLGLLLSVKINEYLFTSLKAAQIQHLEDFAGHMLPLGLS
jgi:hypothetical protein